MSIEKLLEKKVTRAQFNKALLETAAVAPLFPTIFEQLFVVDSANAAIAYAEKNMPLFPEAVERLSPYTADSVTIGTGEYQLLTDIGIEHSLSGDALAVSLGSVLNPNSPLGLTEVDLVNWREATGYEFSTEEFYGTMEEIRLLIGLNAAIGQNVYGSVDLWRHIRDDNTLLTGIVEACKIVRHPESPVQANIQELLPRLVDVEGDTRSPEDITTTVDIETPYAFQGQKPSIDALTDQGHCDANLQHILNVIENECIAILEEPTTTDREKLQRIGRFFFCTDPNWAPEDIETSSPDYIKLICGNMLAQDINYMRENINSSGNVFEVTQRILAVYSPYIGVDATMTTDQIEATISDNVDEITTDICTIIGGIERMGLNNLIDLQNSKTGNADETLYSNFKDLVQNFVLTYMSGEFVIDPAHSEAYAYLVLFFERFLIEREMRIPASKYSGLEWLVSFADRDDGQMRDQVSYLSSAMGQVANAIFLDNLIGAMRQIQTDNIVEVFEQLRGNIERPTNLTPYIDASNYIPGILGLNQNKVSNLVQSVILSENPGFGSPTATMDNNGVLRIDPTKWATPVEAIRTTQHEIDHLTDAAYKLKRACVDGFPISELIRSDLLLASVFNKALLEPGELTPGSEKGDALLTIYTKFDFGIMQNKEAVLEVFGSVMSRVNNISNPMDGVDSVLGIAFGEPTFSRAQIEALIQSAFIIRKKIIEHELTLDSAEAVELQKVLGAFHASLHHEYMQSWRGIHPEIEQSDERRGLESILLSTPSSFYSMDRETVSHYSLKTKINIATHLIHELSVYGYLDHFSHDEIMQIAGNGSSITDMIFALKEKLSEIEGSSFDRWAMTNFATLIYGLGVSDNENNLSMPHLEINRSSMKYNSPLVVVDEILKYNALATPDIKYDFMYRFLLTLSNAEPQSLDYVMNVINVALSNCVKYVRLRRRNLIPGRTNAELLDSIEQFRADIRNHVAA